MKIFYMEPRVAVGGVIFDDKDRVLLVKRKNPPNQGMWAIPGGKVKFGETINEAIRRELKEETSLDVKPTKLLAVVEIIKEGFHYVILDYICEVIGGELRPSSDALDARFLSLEEIKREKVSPTTVEMLEKYFKIRGGDDTTTLPLHILDVTQNAK